MKRPVFLYVHSDCSISSVTRNNNQPPYTHAIVGQYVRNDGTVAPETVMGWFINVEAAESQILKLSAHHRHLKIVPVEKKIPTTPPIRVPKQKPVIKVKKTKEPEPTGRILHTITYREAITTIAGRLIDGTYIPRSSAVTVIAVLFNRQTVDVTNDIIRAVPVPTHEQIIARQWANFRNCPKCFAHKGTRCRSLSCPQIQVAPKEVWEKEAG